ncbi:hypothetical protein BJV85_000105 [Clostridium acetobutylicum]|nr:hypothetical protein [Clostridium acetobutylicum]NOW14520.1 hypothetical protein [Clostridium acetobutylicum]NRY58535.1 hypothetical protein [Clostridium acetobutylicum]NSA91259.1 hypothetical protein [Clostridium acetobutylicum]NYC92193.1 hypothetical protein [Clostridium acetobutylicum]
MNVIILQKHIIGGIKAHAKSNLYDCIAKAVAVES